MDLQHYYDFYGPHNAVEIQLRFQQVQSIYKIDTKNMKLVSFVFGIVGLGWASWTVFWYSMFNYLP